MHSLTEVAKVHEDVGASEGETMKTTSAEDYEIMQTGIVGTSAKFVKACAGEIAQAKHAEGVKASIFLETNNAEVVKATNGTVNAGIMEDRAETKFV